MKNNKNSTEKYGRCKVQHFEEGIEEVVAEEIRSIRKKPKQKEHGHVTKEVSNSQLKKETLVGDGQRKEKEEEPKYSDSTAEIGRTKHSNYNENETENHNVEKEQKDIKSGNCIKCDKCVETRVQCGYCQRWVHLKWEGTTIEKVMLEDTEEMQYICKKTRSTKKRESGKVNIK